MQPQKCGCTAFVERSSVDAVDREILKLFDESNPRGLARAISRAESGGGAALMRALHPRTGKAMTIGLTGPPGVGKSTLACALVRIARTQGRRVGVISVDPSSPFSHGAILGDRIRFSEHFTDADVFIRSMASRGHLGGLAGAAGDAIAFMEAFGKEVVFVETVGVGQSEAEIVELVDTVVVVLQPGTGDSVQLLKAGILEIADVFVVNKADHPTALQLQRDIRFMIELSKFSGWSPALTTTNACKGSGVDGLWRAILDHAAYLRDSGEIERRRRRAFAHRVRLLALGRIGRRLDREIAAHLAACGGESGDPYVVSERIAAHV
jgi:LAO/AO transport system kinase